LSPLPDCSIKSVTHYYYL